MLRSPRPCPKGKGMEGTIDMAWWMDCIALGAMAVNAMMWH